MHLRRLVLIGFLFVCATVLSAGPPALAKSEANDEGVESSVTLVELDALTVNIFRSNYSRGKVEVILSLDVPDANLRRRAVESVPRLRAAYAQTLTRIMYDLPARTPPNIDALSTALQRATNQALGRPGAKLLLGSVVVN